MKECYLVERIFFLLSKSSVVTKWKWKNLCEKSGKKNFRTKIGKMHIINLSKISYKQSLWLRQQKMKIIRRRTKCAARHPFDSQFNEQITKWVSKSGDYILLLKCANIQMEWNLWFFTNEKKNDGTSNDMHPKWPKCMSQSQCKQI